MDFNNVFEGISSGLSSLEKMVGGTSLDAEHLAKMNDPIENPYKSGFDENHPKPTYNELRNAGFSEHIANRITYGTDHAYTEKELFNVLYSPNPVEAYDKMMHEKADKISEQNQNLMKELDEFLASSPL